jgi:hypothetical protein
MAGYSRGFERHVAPARWRLPIGHAADRVIAVAWLLLAAVGIVLAGIDIRVNRLPIAILTRAAVVILVLVAVAALVSHSPRLVGIGVAPRRQTHRGRRTRPGPR